MGLKYRRNLSCQSFDDLYGPWFNTWGRGINKSTNGGTSWTPLTIDVPNAGVTAMVATSSAIYAAINSNGIIKTTNGGGSWTNSINGLWTSAVVSLVKHPTDSTTLYAGTGGNGAPDAFVTKLNSVGSGLLFSTLLGRSKDDSGKAIAVDGSGNITVAAFGPPHKSSYG
jgi:hypothetical protein